MFPIDEQSSFSDPDSATPAAPLPSIPDKQQEPQQTGVTEADTCEQTSGQVVIHSPPASGKDIETEDKTLPDETGEETSSQPINLKTGNNLVTLFRNFGSKHYLSFQICLEYQLHFTFTRICLCLFIASVSIHLQTKHFLHLNVYFQRTYS